MQVLEYVERDPSWVGSVGMATMVLTPPRDIYARTWGSSKHDLADGVHRPLRVSVVAFQETCESPPALLAAADLITVRNPHEIDQLRDALLPLVGGDSSRLMVHFSHSHAVPSISDAYADMPGGDRIAEYRAQVADRLHLCAERALKYAAPANVSWAYGTCDLARNRDLVDPRSGLPVVGYNPFASADRTVLVGRIFHNGKIMGTVVNYACHPTSLGSGNRLVSPDYPGAMRELIELHTDGAPCLFLHGASGDLAPRLQYSPDPAVADHNGRQLGFAALSVLEGMLPPGKGLRFQGVEQSGTALGRWDTSPIASDTSLVCNLLRIPLAVAEAPNEQELLQALESETDPTIQERLKRQLYRRRLICGDDVYILPVWIWRVGTAVIIGVPGEAHSPLQTVLRQRFPRLAIAVLNIVNGTHAYFPPAADFPKKTYQVSISLFASGALETLIERIGAAVVALCGDSI